MVPGAKLIQSSSQTNKTELEEQGAVTEQIGTRTRGLRTTCSGKAWNYTEARMGRKEQNLNGNEIPSNKAKLQVG